MKRSIFIRLSALLMSMLLICVMAGCTSGRTMNTGSDIGNSSDDDWDSYFGNGSTVINGDPNANSGGNVGNNNNNNPNKKPSGSNVLAGNTDNVISSDEFPWPDLKFKSKKVRMLAINGKDGSWPIYCQILKEQYGLEVEWSSADFHGLESKLLQMHAAGNAPDVCWYKWGSHNYFSMALKGMLRDVSEYVDLNNKKLWGDLTSAYKQTKYNNKNYFLITEVPKGPYLVYNKKLFREAGVEDLYDTYKSNFSAWDWNKLQEVGLKLTDKATGVKGLAADDCIAFFHTTGQRFGEFGTTRATTKSNMKNQAFARAAEFITKGRTDGWIDTSVQQNAALFGNEVVAMTFALTDINSEWAEIAKRGDLGIMPMPKDPEADKLWNYKNAYGFVLPTNSQDPNAGLAFALAWRYATVTDEGLNRVEQSYRDLGMTDLNIKQLLDADKAGGMLFDIGVNLGYTNVWNCVLHKHPWSTTFTGETQDVTNTYIDQVFAGVE